jgi:hypothetical protein
VLNAIVALHDVDDVVGFVNDTLNQFCQGRPGKPGVHLSRDEREELVCEGIAIMYDLADRYEPRRGDHEQDGRFSGFAAWALPKKLGDAWHRLHPEHRLVSDPETGKRRWIYLEKHTSFDSVVSSEVSETGLIGGGRGHVHEADVRFLRDFAPIPVPARPRADDESAAAGAVALAA